MGKKKKLLHDADLLVELATLDLVEAEIPTATDHDMAAVPPWCELMLTIKRVDDGTLTPAWPVNARLPLRRHDGELIREVLRDVLHPHSLSTAGEVIWGELDACVKRIQRRVNKGLNPRQIDVGEARGLALALAAIERPDEVDVDAIRAVAMQRYDAQRGISTSES